MINPNTLDELTKALAGLLPPGLDTLKKDFEQNAKAVMQNTFAKLDLVGREEFDIQTALLQRTREKLNQLEQEIQSLEQQLQIKK